jgi:hypothetical protein
MKPTKEPPRMKCACYDIYCMNHACENISHIVHKTGFFTSQRTVYKDRAGAAGVCYRCYQKFVYDKKSDAGQYVSHIIKQPMMYLILALRENCEGSELFTTDPLGIVKELLGSNYNKNQKIIKN